MRLMREIRFFLSGEVPDAAASAPGNSWAGWPATDTFAPYLILRAVVRGDADPQTGYLCSIRTIDRLLRTRGLRHLHRCRQERGASVGIAGCLPGLWDVLQPLFPAPVGLDELTLLVTPHLRFTTRRGDPGMVSMTYEFEFSAAHRLYCDRLSEAENLRIFGRCTNPSGHGHNYIVRVTLQGRPDPHTGTVVPLGQVEQEVNQRVIDVFDHKHLNQDCPEFAALNPSVENITRVIYEKLAGAFEPARLERVRVYETPKTYAEYAGE